jgi:hypothetical protein
LQHISFLIKYPNIVQTNVKNLTGIQPKGIVHFNFFATLWPVRQHKEMQNLRLQVFEAKLKPSTLVFPESGKK